MTPTQLKHWMDSLGFHKSGAASALGISRTTLDGYLAKKHPIPIYIELACEALSLRWQKTPGNSKQPP